MTIEERVERITALLAKHDIAGLKEIFTHMEPVDIAEILSAFPDEKRIVLFRILPKDEAADTFSEMESEKQQKFLDNFTDQEVKDVLAEMYTDDAVDMLEEMPANVVRRVLSKVRPEDRKDINALLKYPEDSAGAVMTTEYIRLRPNMTVMEAIRWIRANGEDSEDLYTCYVTDTAQKLLGVVTVREMLLCKRNAEISDIMTKDVISVHTTEDRENAAKLFDRYDFTTMPVLDAENRLVGIITVDDAIDVMTEEATEDFQKMAGTTPEEAPYLKTPVIRMVGHRIIWLIVLMMADMVSGGILGKFEDTLTAIPVLITFIPMLTDTGGNAGAQSSTLVIRSLALHEISVKDALKVIWKELRVALICGLILGALNYIRILIQYPGHELIGLTVAIAMLCTVVMAKVIGGVLPLIATKLHLDPAMMASPLITTIVDSCSLLIFLSISRALLHIPG